MSIFPTKINGIELPLATVDTAGIIYKSWSAGEPAKVALAKCHRAGASSVTLTQVQKSYVEFARTILLLLESVRQILKDGS